MTLPEAPDCRPTPTSGTSPSRTPRRPPRLHPGDTVAVIAPSGPVDPVRLATGCDTLRSLGLNVTLGDHVHDRTGFLAGSDLHRAHDLHSAWLNPDIRAVICARGGYGATRILNHLDYTTLAAAPPKILLGSSDITALHSTLAHRLNITTFFGPMPATELLGTDPPDPASLAHLRTTLFRPDTLWTATAADALPLVPGTADGATVGGTLTLLAATLGTPHHHIPRNAIALLEDTHEAPYRVDRMLTQLLHAGWFDHITGIIAGSFHRCGDHVDEILHERLAPLGVPILTGLPIGHGQPQLTVPLNARAHLDTHTRRLTLTAPALT